MRIQFLATKKLFQLLLVAVCAMTMATAVEAKSSKKDRVMILEVKINSSADASVCGEASLTITGTGFANKDFPLVFLGNQGNAEPLGDLFVCIQDGAPSDTVIDVVCPLEGAVPVCPIGDFRLEVFTKKGGKSFKKSSKSSNHYDSYDLTIGGGGGSGGDPGLLSIYTASSRGADINLFDVVASCDPGDIVVGGGFQCDLGVGLDSCRATTIISSSKSSAVDWTVSVFFPVSVESPPFDTGITAQAVCLDLGTVHTND